MTNPNDEIQWYTYVASGDQSGSRYQYFGTDCKPVAIGEVNGKAKVFCIEVEGQKVFVECVNGIFPGLECEGPMVH